MFSKNNMVKIVGDTGTLKELKDKLHIDNLKDYRFLSSKLKSKKEELIEKGKEECSKELQELKEFLEVSKEEVDDYLYNHKHDKEHFFSKIKFIIIVYSKTRKIRKLNKKIKRLEDNLDFCSIRKVERQINNIESEQHLIESLKKVYYGAIGEEAVVNEFKHMYSPGILINDFNQHFNEPIFTKGGKDKIMSIQIDHIFLSDKGIFLIETKNRSNNSKETFSFGPVEQVERSGHAFYFYLKKIFQYDKYLRTQKIPTIFKVVVFMGGNKIKTNKPYLDVLYIQELKRFIERKVSQIPGKEYNYIGDVLINDNEY